MAKSTTNQLIDVTNDVVVPLGLFLQENAAPQMEELEELHNNIMFYTFLIIFTLFICVLSYLGGPKTRIFTLIFLILFFLLIALILFMDSDDEIMGREADSIKRIVKPIEWWMDRVPIFGGDYAPVNLSYEKPSASSVIVYDEWDRTGRNLSRVLSKMPDNSTWTVRNNHRGLIITDLHFRREPSIDPSGTFQGTRLDIGPFIENSNVRTNDAPVQMVRDEPFIRKRG